ncbi:Glycosyltransferase involved in cell wall bisynthesis [Bryocella elongata]|uniref:Glycosyltransferase involved in cell wall bisynthesis n=1 Tax=Bryocella elongata TaxID=863522 RepID=A0A1H5Z6Z1_9BACT|nr:glycosyltransferase family 4 protein [Bryocella elongata]SEG32091.1 Glycosyltransferase involved in cell wall bisynthesis [Bryocella elongata]
MNQTAQDKRVRLAYLVSHPIQYQAPLLRRIAREPDIDLTVLFGSDFSVRSYKDEGFGVEVTWDTPLLDGYHHEFLPPLRDTRGVSATSPISRGLFRRLRGSGSASAFDALWVHGYASVNALQGILCANALGIPVLLRAESWLADRPRSPWKLALKGLFLRALSHGIAATLPIGTANLEYWQHYFGDDFPQFLMPYAVDNSYFAAKAAASRSPREELGLEPGRPIILFASKLQERKRAIDLVKAYELLLTRLAGPAPYLVIVGDGEERQALAAYIHDHQLHDVRLAGFRNQSELPGFFAMSDVFVLPSRHEPWGLIVNEAMAAGCAVIVSSDVGSSFDLVTPGVAGYVFPVEDVGALAQSLFDVLQQPGTANRMGRAAVERMEAWSFEQDVVGLREALAYATRRISLSQ